MPVHVCCPYFMSFVDLISIHLSCEAYSVPLYLENRELYRRQLAI